MEQGKLPPRAVCVTFDDGYADNEQLALPVLQECRVPATIFVTTDYLNNGRMWNDTIIESIRLATGSVVDLSTLDLGVYDVSTQSARMQTAQEIITKVKHWESGKRSQAVSVISNLEMTDSLPEDLMLT